MALKARKADEKTSQEFYLYSGSIPMKVLLVNPTAKELEEKLNIKSQEEPKYIEDDKFNEGQKTYKLVLWLSNLPYKAINKKGEVVDVAEDSFRIPHYINISDTLGTTRDNSKKLFVNKYGQST
jgi:hypothetical protein